MLLSPVALKRNISKEKLVEVLRASNPKKLKARIDKRVLEMAIENAKAELAKRGREVSDVSEKQLEIIVNNEEKKIRDSFKNRSITALLAVLGLQIV